VTGYVPPEGPPEGDPQYPYYPPNYGYGYGYYAYPQPEQRPSSVTTAAVLAFIVGGLLLLAGIVLFSGASLVSSLDDVEGTGSFTAELALDGFLDLLAAGLLIGGGTLLMGRQAYGRALYGVGAAIVVVESVYWMVRWTGDTRPFVLYALLFGALAVIGTWLAWTRTASTWLVSVSRR
jgi:hypothetical protein